jgi:RNA polymerase sigma-70 factor (ECF subfamily)
MTIQQRKAYEQSAEERAEETGLLLAARRDLTQFAPLYERYAPRIYGYCLRRLRNRHEAEDLTSLIFTRVLHALDTYRGGSVAAWLFSIAHNAVASHFRAQRPQVPFDSLETDDLQEEDDLLDDVSRDEQQRKVREFLRLLPTDQQELVALKVTAGLTAEEVGQVLGKSAGAVRVEYHRIIKRLRAYFETEHDL